MFQREYSKKKYVFVVFLLTAAFIFAVAKLIASSLYQKPNFSQDRAIWPLNRAMNPFIQESMNQAKDTEKDAIKLNLNEHSPDDEQQCGENKDSQQMLPNALIFGAKKCGTGTLLEMLDIHPDVHVVHYEVHFFDDNFNNGFEWYRQKMPFSYENQITIEKSPRYFVEPDVPARIQLMDPNIRLLLIVRDPVVRLISDYVHSGMAKPFYERVFLPNGEINEEYEPVQVSKFGVHLENYLKYFRRDQIHIADGEELIVNPYNEVKKAEKFLNLSSEIKSSDFYFSENKGFYCMVKESQEKCMSKVKGREHPFVHPSNITRLRQYYAPYNQHFYQVAGQNFDWPTS